MLQFSKVKSLSLVLALCGLLWSNGTEAKVEAEVYFTGSERPTVKQELVSVDNCDYSETSTKKIGVSLTIGEALEVKGGHRLSAGGRMMIFGVDLNVGAEVAQEVTKSYGTDVTQRREIELRTPPFTSRTHIVEHRKKWRDGIIDVKSSTLGVTTSKQRIPFKTCVFYDLVLVGYRDTSCPRPFLQLISLDLQPSRQFGPGCRNGFKYFDLYVGIQNIGNKRSTKFDISASWSHSRGTMTASIVQSGYIEAGAKFTYKGVISLNCSLFPRGSKFKPYIHITLRDDVLTHPETHKFPGRHFVLPY
jgi:hypothetical protein